ncbi:hypothetical protein N9X12_00360 [Alphaproteobacteria bacterium]|nr:hypothetical protein [Alphaproteobacteria bacterium]
MARTTLSNSAGPGSATQLAPQTIKVRDAVIAKCDDQSLDEMNEFVKGLLDIETDELKRLGILAARVYILRQRITALMESGALKSSANKLDFIDPAPEQANDDIDSFADIDDDDVKEANWMRVRIIENCEVNGVRFPSGVIIDVHAEDATRLIEFGKAELQATDVDDDPLPDMTVATDDSLDETTDSLADELSDAPDETPSEDKLSEDAQETDDLADGDDQGNDDVETLETEITDGDTSLEDMPDDVDLTAPIAEDVSKQDDEVGLSEDDQSEDDQSEDDQSEDDQSEDIADNEAIAAAVAEKMPKASASPADDETSETTADEAIDGLQELDDLEDLIETESDENKKDS